MSKIKIGYYYNQNKDIMNLNLNKIVQLQEDFKGNYK